MHYNLAMSMTWLKLCPYRDITKKVQRVSVLIIVRYFIIYGGNRNEKEFRRK